MRKIVSNMYERQKPDFLPLKRQTIRRLEQLRYGNTQRVTRIKHAIRDIQLVRASQALPLLIDLEPNSDQKPFKLTSSLTLPLPLPD